MHFINHRSKDEVVNLDGEEKRQLSVAYFV
jgi:hypothetical protein